MNRNENNPYIRTNMVGYHPALAKHVAVLDSDTLVVLDLNGNEIKRFDKITPKFDEASGDTLSLIDLGELEEGEYILKCNGAERKITVDKSPYATVTDALIKGLYFQRCGCALEEKYAGKYTHAACHTAPALDWSDRSVKKTVTGGWHDAGDYGKYVGPGAVTVAHMLYAYLLFPNGCSNDLNIPETGNGTPDILNEARWELEWILKMQREDGAFHHKLTKATFAGFIMPEEDLAQEYLMPVSHCATGAAVAALALASRIYEVFDKDFSEKMLDSAVNGWKWLEANPEFIPFVNPEGVRTGMYGDWSDKDEIFWAACELFASTGDSAYQKAAERLYKDALDPEKLKQEEDEKLARFKKFHPEASLGLNITQYGWADVSGLGAVCCIFVLKEKAGSILYDELKKDFLARSAQALEYVNVSGYGTALAADQYVWGSILPIMSNAMSMIFNYLLTGNDTMKKGALNQLDYALGLNALDLSFVTGFGEKHIMNPHHRPSGADGIEEPVPGLISGGPNKRWTYPETKERFGDSVPAAKYFLDETPSADTNEIAIYWNSPAIFVAAFFNAEA